MRHSFLFSALLWLGTSSALYGQTNPGTFTFTGSMSVQRQIASATLITGCNCPADGKVLVAGGVIDGTSFTTNTAELYDPATGKFTPTGTMNVARGGQVAALLPGGKVLIVGAFDSQGPFDAEIYDPVSGTFSCVAGSDPATGYCNPTLAHNGVLLTATSLQNGNVLITGLQTPASFGQTSNAAAIYDSLQTSFTCISGTSSTPLVCNPSTTSQHTSGTATLLVNGTVLIAGGSGASGFTSSAEIYDPTIGPNGAFVTTGSLLTTRANHAAALLKTGEVLIAGGGNGSGNFNTAEVYAGGTFTAVGNMAHARLYPTATLLNDGTVLIAGGCCEISNQQMPYAEIYNPTTKTFSPTGDMNDARATHTATLLSNGQVLVAGGLFDATAELYTANPSPCQVSSTKVDQSNSNGVISVSTTGSGCLYTVTITNLKSYWTNFRLMPVGSVNVNPVGGDLNLFAKFGILAPAKSVSFQVGFSQPAQALSIFADPTVETGAAAGIMNVAQAIINTVSIVFPLGKIELSILDAGQVLQAFDQMPHLKSAVVDLFQNPPNFQSALVQLAAFGQSAEPSVFEGLLLQLGFDVGRGILVDLLQRPGAIANALTTAFGNFRTAFFGYPAGSAIVTAQ